MAEAARSIRSPPRDGTSSTSGRPNSKKNKRASSAYSNASNGTAPHNDIAIADQHTNPVPKKPPTPAHKDDTGLLSREGEPATSRPPAHRRVHSNVPVTDGSGGSAAGPPGAQSRRIGRDPDSSRRPSITTGDDQRSSTTR